VPGMDRLSGKRASHVSIPFGPVIPPNWPNANSPLTHSCQALFAFLFAFRSPKRHSSRIPRTTQTSHFAESIP
jgi:hypothetical protein